MVKRWSKASLAKVGFWFIVVGILIRSMVYLQPWFATASSPSKSVGDTDISGLTVTTIWDAQLIKDQSTHIEVYIHQPLPKIFPSSDIIVPRQISTHPMPVGTAGVPTQKVQGSRYDVIFTAQFSASAFDGAFQTQRQSIDQQQVQFTWVASPKYIGKQIINVIVTGIWTPQNGGPPIERILARHLLHTLVVPTSVQVDIPFFSLGQFNLSGFLSAGISAGIGSLFTGPWLLEYIKRRRIKNKRSRSRSSSISTAPIPSIISVPSAPATPPASSSISTAPTPSIISVPSAPATPPASSAISTVPTPSIISVPSAPATPPASNSISTVPTPSTLCESLTKKGSRCKNKAKQGSKHCWRHETKDHLSHAA